jgi:outer membrane lipoprotein-sorting protein
MMDASHPRRPGPGRSASPRAGVCLTSLAVVLGLALLTLCLSPASAQQAPVGAQGPAASPPTGGLGPDAQAKEKEEPPTPSERFIDEAKAKLAKLQSFAADVEQRVDMLNQHFTLKGRALKAPQNRVYFRLTLSGLPDTSGTTLQVCDGDTLWDYQQILQQQIYHKFSVKPVMERLNSPELDPKFREQYREGMGFAGPETLLAGLRRLFRFEQEKVETKLGDKAVWKLVGTWKDRKSLTGPDQRMVNQFGMLPPYIPGLAILYLGKDDGWPYQLELTGQKPTILQDTRKIGPDGRPIGSRSSIETVDPTKIVLVYSDVKLNPTLNIDEFVFQAPPAASVDDGTEMIVKFLDSQIAMQAQQKKAETTKKEGPVLDQPLDIPPPPGVPAAGQPSNP